VTINGDLNPWTQKTFSEQGSCTWWVVARDSVKNEGREAISQHFSIDRDELSRSQKQNSLYWEWVSVIGGQLGYTKDETHTILRDKFLGYNEVTTKLSVIKELRSTTKLKVGEFKDYLEQIDIFVSEWGIVLPHPEDLYYESMGFKR